MSGRRRPDFGSIIAESLLHTRPQAGQPSEARLFLSGEPALRKSFTRPPRALLASACFRRSVLKR